MPLIRKQESIWARLTRLFRNGPIIRHKIASTSRMYEPQGTARAYKKELSSLYVNSLASYGQYERLARYADYSEMEYTPEIATALDIYADEVTSVDEKEHMVEVESDDEEIKAVLETFFFDIINVEFNLHSWVRNLCKYGDFILFVDASETNGILNLLPIPINEIEREEGYDQNNPFAFRFRWLTQGNMILEAWQIIHFRLLGNDNFLPYGSSVIEPARRVWRQLILIEDAMLVYRIVRSPERRVFKIEVGNVKPTEIPQFMDEMVSKLKRSPIADSTTGRVDLRYNPLSVDEDYFIPMRNGQGSSIESLPGGQFTGDIEDVEYIQNKLFAALKIPKSYLTYDGDVGSKATLAQEDVRFSRTIQRIQKIVLSELTKIAVIHLFILGYTDDELVNFEIKMANPSTVAEQQKLELWRTRFEVAGSAQEGMMDKETVWRDIFGYSDDKIKKIQDGMKFDKMFELELENMQAPGAGEDLGAGGELPAGEDQLPNTLGGEPAGGGEEPIEADVEKSDEEDELVTSMRPTLLRDDSDQLDEDGDDVEGRNPGSEGDDAIVSVTKGKDLFAPGEDLYTHVFGTEKQTASDPSDLRSLARQISRPFSESAEEPEGELREALDPVGKYVHTKLIEAENRNRRLQELDRMVLEAKIKRRT